MKQFGSEPGFGYYNAYAAMLALIHGIEKAGSTDTAKIIEVLHNDPVDTPIGSLMFSSGMPYSRASSFSVAKFGVLFPFSQFTTVCLLTCSFSHTSSCVSSAFTLAAASEICSILVAFVVT